MATDLIDLGVPGLGSALTLLDTLYTKYSELKEGKELCARLDQRLKDFAEELSKIASDTMKADELLRRLVVLIRKFSKTITTFAGLNFVKRVMKLDAFRQDVEIYHERLDHIIKMITVNQSDKLSRLLQWRTQFDQDAANMAQQLAQMLNMQREIWMALKSMEKSMATKRDIEELVLVAKRDVSDDSDPERTPQPLDPVLRNIIDIAQVNFLDKNVVKTPPTWLIAADEVTKCGKPIDREGLTSIFVGEWQGAQVALKTYEVIGESPVFDKHFRVWNTLLHPYVAQLYGAGSDNGAPFFVYEYASRQSLDRCWGQLSEREIFSMLHQAALGLAYLHKKHVVHGNLSCSKLLVTDQNTVKVFGFGASYFRESNQSNSLKVETREDFAAPECVGIGANGNFRGDGHSPRFESDVYSLGLTIIEAMTKKDPFAGMSSADTRKLKRSNEFLEPTPDMSDDAWTLVKQMCVCDPSQRVSLAYVAEQLGRLAQ
ncbi:Serine/threonine-protein kinase pim-3 [Phytophthora pseudosyringae]|uniref:Serine/threonine-protein kinase pim-3 n=1 Tax=Phytophthora pseudosyringae TaxID=221518 RepID=A0A8T1VKS1_9STRA|nr:Serine/threonine-protein kinase pim-3 [Phytophthora pseudosyringae]